MLRQIEQNVQNGSTTKNGVFFFFGKFNLGIKTSFK